MTICIAVKVHDCLVFVTDSASSMVATGPNGQNIVMRVYDHGHKLFNLIRGKPISAMTCGLGNFGGLSVSNVAKEIRREIMHREAIVDDVAIDPDNYTVEAVAKYCFSRFEALFNDLAEPVRNASSFSFFVGGHSGTNAGNELWKFHLAGAQAFGPDCLAGEGECSIEWDGQPEACVRLVLGISSQTRATLLAAGLTPEQTDALEAQIVGNSEVHLLDPSMPVQDAIDLAKFLAETTVSFVRFLPGANTVGGDLDIATVTKFEGFRWIKRKHYYPASLNSETNHG